MSVLQVYLNWANSVLSDLGELPCEGVSSVQEGRLLCQLIDKLSSEAQLIKKVETSGTQTPHSYLRAALDHMRNHGIKFHFTPQDILDGDIKSILDVLWLIILNYGLHSINSSPYQRSVGIGKKLLLDWCQRELQVTFDPQNSLTYNLCTGDWFLKLLSKHAGVPINENVDREENLKLILSAVERSLGIKQDIINPSDITEGTVDEHNLMIYVSLLRLKVGDDVDVPLTSPSDISFQSSKSPLVEESPKEVPAIVLSEVQEDRLPTPEAAAVVYPDNSPKSGSSGDSADRSQGSKHSLEGTGSETSDWLSQSSNSPISSVHDKNMDSKSDNAHAADNLIKDTISQHVEEVITPSEEMKAHSRIPVRIRSSSDENDVHGQAVTRKISVKVQRPRSPNSIMAEARIKQEQERERRRKEREDSQKARKEEETEEPVLTGSASEAGEASESGRALRKTPDVETEPLRSDEDDSEKLPPRRSISPIQVALGSLNGEVKEGVPVFIMPDGQKHDMSVLLEALRHARTEANIQDQKIQNGVAESSSVQQVVDKDIEELEAQLQAVKAQSKELFEHKPRDEPEAKPSRGRVPVREPHVMRRGERRSPPRGILDVMANQDVEAEQTIPKYSSELPPTRILRDGPERHTPTSILRNRVEVRSPSDYSRQQRSEDFQEDGIKDWSQSPERRVTTPLSSGRDSSEDEQDPDKRLIKFLTKEIENLKLKMAILEKSKQRSQSPYGMGPRVTGGIPERERSPGQISSRARARFSDLESEGSVSSYSPNRFRSPSLPEERSTRLISEHSPVRSVSPGRVSSRSPARLDGSPLRSRSPLRLDGSPVRSRSPGSSLSRSPGRTASRSPVSMYRSRTPENLCGERISRPFTPRVLSLQDLSTSIMDDPDGKIIFSPASGAKPVDLGYSSPIRKVTQEIWGYDQTEDEYFSDTAKYEQWKRLISRDMVTDEDMLELKQALASCLVELDIVSAKLKNANSDIKQKMAKTSEVLNDCRAHLTKSQAENAELRSQNEKEKTRADAVELRMKDMEENLHSAKTNQDDLTQELEESVITLKGIVGLDKNNLAKLGEENDKLRQKLSDTQRENIKLKEDFNELKMYNDKAQTTIKDLKTCLEDARSERKQLVGEIKSLQNQGKNNQISSIVNHYMEKGLYEEPEKAMPRSRSPSPRRPVESVGRSRSVSPVRSRIATPVMSSSPVKPTASYQRSDYTSSRSQTPTNFQTAYNYEDISPAIMSDGHEIYPHRRTRSYIQKYGEQNEDRPNLVDLDDPELQELLKPKAKLTYDVDLNDSYPKLSKSEPYNGGQIFSAKRQLKYSPYMDKDFVPKSRQVADYVNTDIPKKSPMRVQQVNYKTEDNFNEADMDDIDDNKFIEALDSAVRETPVQRAQRQFLEEVNRTALDEDFEQRINQAKGILKSNKSSQNLSIKENIPAKRSVESRSYSPSVRNPLSRSHSMNIPGSRSISPGTRLQTAGRSHSSGNPQSPSNRASRSVSPGVSRSFSPGDRLHGTRDSGYSTPTNGTSGRQRPAASRMTQPRSKFGAQSSGKSLLSDDERRYADLLIDKYTRQPLIGVSLTSS